MTGAENYTRFLVGILAGLLLLCLPVQEAWAQTPAMLPDTQVQRQVDIEGHLDLAHEFMRQGKWDFAAYEFRFILKKVPQHPEAQLGLAQALIQGEQFEDAIDHLLVLRQQPNASSQVFMVLAGAYQKSGRYRDAALLYRDQLAKDATNVEALKGLVDMLPKMPKTESAQWESFLAQESQKNAEQARKALLAADYDKATVFYELATVYKPTIAKMNDRAVALLLAGRYRQAADLFQKLYASGKGKCTIHPNAAVSLLSIGKSTAARKLMENTLNECSSPQSRAQMLNNMGYIYELNKDWLNARMSYEEANRLQPSLTKAAMNLGFVYEHLSKLDEALALYNYLITQDPSNARAWTQIGYVYEKKKQNKQAVQAYRKAIEVNPQYRDAYYNLIMLYRGEGKLAKADELLRQMPNTDIVTAQKDTKLTESKLFQYIDVFLTEPIL